MPMPIVLTCACPKQRWLGLLVLPLALACSADNLKPAPLVEPDSIYWDLAIDHRAVTLSMTAPYDTLTLAATPRNHRGEPLVGLPAPQFTSNHPEQVLVTADGVVLAISPTTSAPVAVTATLTADNLKHVDTAYVMVVDNPTPPVLATFAFQITPPDSAKTAAGEGRYLLNPRIRATDPTDVPIGPPAAGFSSATFLIDYRSSDTTVLIINENTFNPYVAGQRVGVANISASATVFGVAKADTLPFRIGWPLQQTQVVSPTSPGSPLNVFLKPVLRVGVGALITWRANGTNAAVDVTFTDPTNVAAPSPNNVLNNDANQFLCFFLFLTGGFACDTPGNFVLPPTANSQFGGALNARVFPVPGTYEYHSTLNNGVGGQIIVVDER